MPVARYLERCRLKTGVLFRAACELGAIHGRGPVQTLGAFGETIGIAFQLLDDILDVTGPPERTGKPRGADLLDGTVTLPLLLARERSAQLAALDPRSIDSDERAAAVCDQIAATGALELARTRALDMIAAGQGDSCRCSRALSAGRSSLSPTASSSATPDRRADARPAQTGRRRRRRSAALLSVGA